MTPPSPRARIAGRAAYERLIEAGVELYEFQPTMLHAKSVSIAGRWRERSLRQRATEAATALLRREL
ncbi:MAG: hypothetical protein GEU88_09575 [Solirubrobacterales bacterium]|nr:hypothetical protein [Solirubrobacterales bacterium]